MILLDFHLNIIHFQPYLFYIIFNVICCPRDEIMIYILGARRGGAKPPPLCMETFQYLNTLAFASSHIALL